MQEQLTGQEPTLCDAVPLHNTGKCHQEGLLESAALSSAHTQRELRSPGRRPSTQGRGDPHASLSAMTQQSSR